MLRTLRPFAGIVVAAMIGAGCTSAINGTPNGSPTLTAPGLKCAGPATTAIVSCLRRSLRTFWSQQLGKPITAAAVLAPSRQTVPRECRFAIRAGTAFTCPIRPTVYLTGPYIERLRTASPRSDGWYRFAATMGHEFGHVVQFTVRDPLVEKDKPTDAESQHVEQQADCLSGVWAASVGLPDAQFRAAAEEVFGVIDSDFERRTHGDPRTRLAAIQRGQVGRSAQACGLKVR